MLSLDDDDLLLPRTLQMHADFMSEHPDMDWAFGRTLLIDQDGRLLNREWGSEPHELAAGYSDEPGEFFEILLRGNAVTGNTAVVRREALADVGGWDENVNCQDWGPWLSLASNGRRHAFRDCYICCRRVHEHQLTTVRAVDGSRDRDHRYFLSLYGR